MNTASLHESNSESGGCPYHNATGGLITAFEPLDTDIRLNPFPYYQYLHDAKNQPVYKVPSEDNFYIVSGYDEIKSILMDPYTFDGNIFPENKPFLMSTLEPERHRKVRNVVQSMFTTKAITRMNGDMQIIAKRYTDELLMQGRCDLMGTWALKIPLNVISSMFGLPDDHDSLQKLHVWGDAIVRLLIPLGGTGPKQRHSTWQQKQILFKEIVKSIPSIWSIYRIAGKEGLAALSAAQVKFSPLTPRQNFHSMEYTHYFFELAAAITKLFDERRKNPGNDVIDLFIEENNSQQEVSFFEMIFACIQILVAGYETTASSLGNAVYRFIKEPDLLQHLKAHPEDIGAFIEENLRIEAPLQRTIRRTTKAVVLGETEIPENSNLIVILGAGNRDSRQFECPEIFNLHRPNSRSHLTFGKGIHTCLGASLNRVESEIALQEFVKRVKSVELDTSAAGPEHLSEKDIGMWALTKLPVIITPEV